MTPADGPVSIAQRIRQILPGSGLHVPSGRVAVLRLYGPILGTGRTAEWIELARRLLLAGQRPAEVAAAVGFYDQSHLSRHFKRHLGVSPARYPGRPTATGRQAAG